MLEARQLDRVPVSVVVLRIVAVGRERDGEDQASRREQGGSTQQRVGVRGLRSPRKVGVKLERRARKGDGTVDSEAGQRGLNLGGQDTAEDEIGQARPEAAPPA